MECKDAELLWNHQFYFQAYPMNHKEWYRDKITSISIFVALEIETNTKPSYNIFLQAIFYAHKNILIWQEQRWHDKTIK